MKLKWTDTTEIAIQLCDKYPTVDPQTVNFVDLHQWVMGLADFEDDPKRSGEKVLEAIQQCWIDEKA